jgi:hypothetical protein
MPLFCHRHAFGATHPPNPGYSAHHIEAMLFQKQQVFLLESLGFMMLFLFFI